MERARQFDAPSNNGHLEYLYAAATLGQGRELASIASSSRVFEAVCAETFAAELLQQPTVVFLTPQTTMHPVDATSETVFTRGVSQFRSFHALLPRRDSSPVYTLVVKGGDLLNTEGVTTHLTQLKDGQDIPGSGTERDLSIEYDAALLLQQRALQKLGRLTYVPVPIALRTIDAVPRGDGTMVDSRTFLNSSDYAVVPGNIAEYLGLGAQRNIGDMVFDTYHLQPTEYLYLTQGPNVRANEPQYMLFTPATLSAEATSTRIRNLFTLLADGYNFNLETLFRPSEHLTLSLLQERLGQHAEIAEQAVKTFIDRLVEVVALAHSMRYTFMNAARDSGGSLVARNTTCFGVVCDLESFREMTAGEEDQDVLGDFKNMILTIGVMRKVFSSTQLSLGDYIIEAYKQKLQQFADQGIDTSGFVALVDNPEFRSLMETFL